MKVARGSRALADEAGEGFDLFADPIGNRLEVSYGAENAGETFKAGRSISAALAEFCNFLDFD